MLYESWRRICGARPQETALRELSTGREWTFAALARAAEEQSLAPANDMVFPSGNSADFVLQVLASWHSDRVLCPLEPGQPEPRIGNLPEGVAHLKTTSASTGSPRLVCFTGSQLMADAANIVATMGLRPDWPNLGLISLAHSYGFSNLVLPLLLHGIPLVLVGSALPESVKSAASRLSNITIAGVPALWRTWLEADAIPANLRLAISAGAALPLDLERAVFERHGVKIHNFYGSSECGGICYDASDKLRAEPGCVGAPMRNVDVSIGANGCVEVRGAAVGETYWPEPASNLADGVFRTSDLGKIKGDLIYLHGRASDQINVAGRKVLPEAIEAVLSTHPQVRACLAFGVPGMDPQRGETIVACVAGQPQLTTDNLKQFAISRLPSWQVPREWWLVKTLKSNERGKVSRAEWRQRFLKEAQNRRSLRHGTNGILKVSSSQSPARQGDRK